MNRFSKTAIVVFGVLVFIASGCGKKEESAQQSPNQVKASRQTTPESANAPKQEATTPLKKDVKANSDIRLPFGVATNQVEGLSAPDPGAGLYQASCKEGYQFIIVATTELPKGKRISQTELDHVLVDDSGNEYKPVAFGLPRKWKDTTVLFIVYGFSFTGDIENDIFEKTVMGLLYLVPKQAKRFSIRKPSGKTDKLEFSNNFRIPETMTAWGLNFYGRVDFGTPLLRDNGWGLLPSK